MKIFTLYREQYLPISVEEAWQFFSSAQNLKKITPPEMRFKILTEIGAGEIYSGMRIQYIVRPLINIPLNWETEIASVHAPYKFVDRQLKGPYALWEHTHTFITTNSGVKMTDEVRYALPLGWLGIFMHRVIVKKKLEDIFLFRQTTLLQLFGEYK